LGVRGSRERAAVRRLDDVEQAAAAQLLANGVAHPSADEPVVRVLQVDEPALGADPLCGLDRGQAGRHRRLQEEADQLAVAGVDLLPDDDREARPLAQLEGAGDRVVVGDRDDVDEARGVRPLVVGRPDLGVVGAVGVVVEVEQLAAGRRHTAACSASSVSRARMQLGSNSSRRCHMSASARPAPALDRWPPDSTNAAATAITRDSIGASRFMSWAASSHSAASASSAFATTLDATRARSSRSPPGVVESYRNAARRTRSVRSGDRPTSAAMWPAYSLTARDEADWPRAASSAR